MGATPTAGDLKTFKEWHEKARKVMYWLLVSVLDSMIVHIQDAKMPKEAWDTLVKMYNTNITMQKMQLKQELHNMQRNKLSINEYSMKVKGLVDSLGSIGVPIDDKDLVFATLNVLGREYAQFRTSIGVRETFPDFYELVALLLSEEQRNGGSASSQESSFYSNQNRVRGRGRGRFGGHSTNQNQQQQQETNPMEEDVVTLEAGRGNSRGAKEDEVHGKGINK